MMQPATVGLDIAKNVFTPTASKLVAEDFQPRGSSRKNRFKTRVRLEPGSEAKPRAQAGGGRSALAGHLR